jgi:uncharacterized membrane protein
MKTRHRFLIAGWLYVWAVIGLFFTDHMAWFIMPVLGLAYAFFGGGRHA